MNGKEQSTGLISGLILMQALFYVLNTQASDQQKRGAFGMYNTISCALTIHLKEYSERRISEPFFLV